MRANYVGNTALQERLHRPDPEVRAIVEAVVVSQEDTRETQGEWAGSGSGLTRPQIGGARLIRDTDATHAQHDTASADQENTATDLDNESPWFMLVLEWSEIDADDFEIHSLTATLDPDVDGTGREVAEFRCQLYQSVAESDGSETVELRALGAQGVAEVSGNSQSDFTFDLSGGEVGSPPEPGDSPGREGGGVGRGGGTSENDPITNPRTFIKIWAVDSDGAAAGNCAWVGDNDDSAASTLVTDGSTNTADASFLELRSLDNPRRNVGGEFEKFGNGDGIPDFSLDGIAYTEATATFGSIDLGSAPAADTDLVVVAQGEEPSDSSLTWELSDDGGSTWHTVADGDVIGEDNSPDGNDLSGVSRQQTYDMRVTLSPSSDGHTSPFARRIGVEEMTTTDLDQIADVEDAGNWSFDPVSLTGEIPEATISLLKDGVRDYRSEGERLFAQHHIGDMTFRVWIGHADLPRKHWLHVDTFEVDDYSSEGAAIEVTGLSPLRRLKTGVPPYDTSNNERTPVEYTNQTLKAAWDDLLDSQVALPGRFRGSGVEDTTSQSVSKTLRDSDGKTELDAIAHLAGGTVVTSQGKVKYQDAFTEGKGGVRATFAKEEIQVVGVTPGYKNRVEEYFVPYAYDDDRDDFDGEVRSFYAPSIAKLGGKGLDMDEDLDSAVARWLPTPNDTSSNSPDQNLAAHVARRTTSPDGLGPGLKQVRFENTIPHPELEPGDAVVVETDQLVIKDPATDRAFRGLLWLTGVIQVQHDIWGTEHTVWVQQIEDATPSEEDSNRQSFADPAVTGASGSWDDAGNVDVTGKVREADAVRIATSTSSFPSKSTTQSATLQSVASDNTFDVSGLTTIGVGQTAFVSILAYENSDGTGSESTLYKLKVRRTTQEATQNLLASDAGPEHSFTDWYDYLDAASSPSNTTALTTLGLEVGDVISASTSIKTDGSSGAQGRLIVAFFESDGTFISNADSADSTAASTTYERLKVENETIPANCTHLRVRADNTNNDGNTIFSRKAMLNRGPIAYSFVEPPARVNRGEVDPAVIEEFQVLSWAFNGCTGNQMTITMEWVVSNFSSSEFTITLEFWGDWDGDGVYGMKDSETADSQIADTTASSDHYTYSEIPYKDDTNCAARDSYVKMLVTRDSTGEVVSKEVSRTIRFNAHACIDGQCAAQITGAE